MEYIIIDFEWNGTISRITKEYFNELIELGGVKLDDDLNYVSGFRTLIRPVHHKKLTGRVKRLTNISNDDVRSGMAFSQAFDSFVKWVGDAENCFMSWGTGDILVLIENLKFYNITDRLSVIKNYCDAQALCQSVLKIDGGQQPGLSLVAQMAGISCDDMDMHRALDDSVVTSKCIKALWNDEVFNKLVSKADKSFYDRITFRQFTVSDIKSPLLEGVSYKAKCPVCGRFMKRITKLKSRSRSICAEYICQKCEKTYDVRHHFKQKYDGLVHKITFKEKTEHEEEENL